MSTTVRKRGRAESSAAAVLASGMLLLGAGTAIASTAAWKLPRHVVLKRAPGGWVSVEVHSLRERQLSLPSGWKPEEVALTSDERVVFTAIPEPGKDRLLFVWDSKTPDVQPVSIGDAVGFHSNPTVTLDGQWAYFAHNPAAHGPPGSHGGGAFAQIYRGHLDGSSLEALTEGAGCHFAPSAPKAEAVAYVHSSCRVAVWVELLRRGSKTPLRVTHDGELLNHLEVSPDSRSLLLSVHRPSETEVKEIDLASLKETSLFVKQGRGGSGVAYYRGDARSLLFEENGALSTWSRGGKQAPVTLAKGGDAP